MPFEIKFPLAMKLNIYGHLLMGSFRLWSTNLWSFYFILFILYIFQPVSNFRLVLKQSNYLWCSICAAFINFFSFLFQPLRQLRCYLQWCCYVNVVVCIQLFFRLCFKGEAASAWWVSLVVGTEFLSWVALKQSAQKHQRDRIGVKELMLLL